MKYSGPIVLAILDGVGLAPDSASNAVSRARTPFLGFASKNYLHTAIEASGEEVGVPRGQMGNSEVGHNTMGAGKIVKQGAARIDAAIKSRELFRTNTWRDLINWVLAEDGRTLHFAGIFSDGGVHSDIRHLFKMIAEAYQMGVRRMRVHAIFDGRDTPPFSALEYVQMFEAYVGQFDDADIQIACGGGRMVFVADRYESNWDIVARGWDAMVNGEANYYFKSADEAIQVLRRIEPGVQDQNLPAFVIVDAEDRPVGKIQKGDALVYFDFRADRAMEIAEAFTRWDFPHFNRGTYKPDDVYFVGMTEYKADTHLPKRQLMPPVSFGKTLHEVLGENGVSQLACSETVKFGHVTYYFNGNSFKKARGEEFMEIESFDGAFETRPWMRCAEITDAVIAKMPGFRFVRLNYPGGDMVGHMADFNATVMAMEAIDLSLRRLAEEVDKLGGALVIVADHGNAEELLDENGEKKTSHTTNKVPFIIYDNTPNRELYELDDGVVRPGLKNLAATLAVLLGVNAPAEWEAPLIRLK